MHAGYLRLQTHTQNMKYAVLFHSNNCRTDAPRYCFVLHFPPFCNLHTAATHKGTKFFDHFGGPIRTAHTATHQLHSCPPACYTFIYFVKCFLGCADRFVNLLKPTGHVTHQQFNIQQLYVLPTLYLCVLYLSENKQRLVPLTA